MAKGDEGIGAFERQDAADGAAVRSGGQGRGPEGDMGLHGGAVPKDADFAGLLHRLVPCALGTGHRPCLGLRGPPGDGAVGIVLNARDLGGHADAGTRTAHGVEADRATAAVGLVLLVGLVGTDGVEGPGEVTVPFDRVHGEVEVGVQEEHGQGMRGGRAGLARGGRPVEGLQHDALAKELGEGARGFRGLAG